MSAEPVKAIIDDHIVALWNQGKNTFEISEIIGQFLRRPFPEHQVSRVLTAVRANQAKGGAE